MSEIERTFADLRGKPCWGVKRGQGSFLTLEFGEPRLVIREPIRTESASRKVRRSLARRHVYVAGEWHLWVYCCDWMARSGSRVIGDSSSVRRIERAARLLDSQKLLSVELSARGARTLFHFDLGAVLETRPYDRTSEQWLLYEPSGRVLVLRADRRFSHGRGNASAEKWRAA